MVGDSLNACEGVVFDSGYKVRGSGRHPFANANARTDCGVHNQNQEASGEATTFDVGQNGVQLAYRWSVGKE